MDHPRKATEDWLVTICTCTAVKQHFTVIVREEPTVGNLLVTCP